MIKFIAVIIIITLVLAYGIVALTTNVFSATTISCSDPRGCPDLIIDPNLLPQDGYTQTREFAPEDCAVQEGLVPAGTRRLLPLDTAIINAGRGALHVGNLYLLSQTNPELAYFDACHNHIHIRNFTAYRLWTLDQYDQWERLTQGKWTYANSSDPGWIDQQYGSALCDPDAFYDWDISGIGPRWGDIYGYPIPGQWLDVTDSPAGTYVVEEEVNPARVIEETNYRNNSVSTSVTIQ